MSDSIEYCNRCETNVMCHLERKCMLGDCSELHGTACSTLSTPRTIKVEFYVEAFGETFTKEVEIVSPPVSNMPDPQIQASADFAVARQYLNTFHSPRMGVTIL